MNLTDRLPNTIKSYLTSHTTRDLDGAMQWYTDDAEVIDDGKTYRGPDEIRAWLANAATEYTYTTELTATHQLAPDTYTATHHLKGNFPGGTADLDFTFTLSDNRIARLDIS